MRLGDKLSDIIEHMSSKKLLMLCGILAIIVFIIIYFILSALLGNNISKNNRDLAGKVPVIEASKDIAPHTVITEDMIQAVEIDPALVPSGALTDKNAVVGKKAGIELFAGDVITARKLAQKPGGFVGLIPDGMRAVSFSANDVTGVSGFAKPGDKVDILLVTSREGVDRITSKILLKDVLILAVNKSSSQPQSQNTDKDGKNNSNSNVLRTNISSASIGTPSVVTVALTPYDAAKLAASAQIGQLQLLLRPSNDEGDHYVGYYVIPLPKAEALQPQPAPQPVYAAPQPASAPAVSISSGGAPSGFSGIEVIRGTNVSRGQ